MGRNRKDTNAFHCQTNDSEFFISIVGDNIYFSKQQNNIRKKSILIKASELVVDYSGIGQVLSLNYIKSTLVARKSMVFYTESGQEFCLEKKPLYKKNHPDDFPLAEYTLGEFIGEHFVVSCKVDDQMKQLASFTARTNDNITLVA